MTELRISKTLALPLDVVTKTSAIIAQRRKGKTYTASVVAEEMVAAGVPFVALDPTGAWWGLRSSADGKRSGLPVVVLGGQHGDIPIERTVGKEVAQLVIDEPGWYVIDFSLFESGGAERQFATDFAERLYRAKNQPGRDFPLHLFVDEANRFVPQTPRGGKGDARETDARMLGAFEAIVLRGGLRGLGATLVTQRPAVVNKNVLEQIDILIALRIVGPNDRKAIDLYLQSDADDEQRLTMMRSLASLEIGEAWVWEPGGDPPLFDRVRIRQRKTFNSSATPKPGQARVEPKVFAQVDLDRVKEQMAAVAERAERDDPKRLHARIKVLERELATKRPEAIVETVTETIEVMPAWAEEALQSAVDTIGLCDDAFARLGTDVRAQIDTAREAIGLRLTDLGRIKPKVGAGSRGHATRRTAAPPRASTAGTPKPPPAPTNATLGKRERAILAALATYPDGRTQRQLAMLCGYSAKASTIGAGLSELRKVGYVTPHGIPTATPDGIGAARAMGVEPLPTGPALLDYWRGELGERERRFLDVLIDVWPDRTTNDALAEACGYSRTASTVGAGMSKLRTLGLASGWRASDEFIEAIA